MSTGCDSYSDIARHYGRFCKQQIRGNLFERSNGFPFTLTIFSDPTRGLRSEGRSEGRMLLSTSLQGCFVTYNHSTYAINTYFEICKRGRNGERGREGERGERQRDSE